MDEREADPTGSFSRAHPEDARPDAGDATRGDSAGDVDETERDVITSATAATSEVADPEAQAQAEGQGDGTAQPG
jgi:hypothetical protein